MKKRKAEHTGHISQGRWKTIRLGIEHDVAMGSLPAGQPRRQWRTQDAPGGGNQLSIAWFSPQRRDGRRMAVLMESDVLLMRIKMNARRDRQLQDERGGDDKREERERKKGGGERGKGERRDDRREGGSQKKKRKKIKSNRIKSKGGVERQAGRSKRQKTNKEEMQLQQNPQRTTNKSILRSRRRKKASTL